MDEQTSTTKYQGLSVLILASIFLCGMIAFEDQSSKKDDQTKTLEASAISSFEFSHSPFEQAIFQADVVYVESMNTEKVLYQNNAHIAKPLASLAKIMTAYAALRIFPEDSKLTISSEDLRSPGDHGLISGEVWKLEDLLTIMLLASSNDAANTVEREAKQYLPDGTDFSQYMTEYGAELGFDSLIFQNASGLDLDKEETLPSALGNAEDISKLFKKAFLEYPEIFNTTQKEVISLASDLKTHHFENTNTAIHGMPGIIGSKTGYTNTAGGNLSVVVDISGIPHIVTVLQSTRNGRFEDVENIIGLMQK